MAQYAHNTNSLNRDSFQPQPVIKPERTPSPVNMVKAKMSDLTYNRGSMDNWGPQVRYFEKEPQYPVYSLPHRFDSLYQASFKDKYNEDPEHGLIGRTDRLARSARALPDRQKLMRHSLKLRGTKREVPNTFRTTNNDMIGLKPDKKVKNEFYKMHDPEVVTF